MTVRHLLISAFLLALQLLRAAPGAAQVQLAITAVTVVDVADGSLRPDQTALIDGDRIASVGNAGQVAIPAGAAVIDGRGKYLIPGLWDMHAHSARQGRAPRFWPLFVAHGVTGIREMGSHIDSLQHWRVRAERPGVVAPRVHWSSAVLDGSPPRYDWFVVVPDAEAARAEVERLQNLDFDFLKVYGQLSREVYFAITREARRRGMPFAGHVPLAISPVEASDAGQKSFDHPTDVLMECFRGGRELLNAHARAAARYGEQSDSARAAAGRVAGVLAYSEPDPSACSPLFARMVVNRTWFTPTLTLYRGETQPSRFDGDPRLRFVPSRVAKSWAEGRRLPPELEAEIGGKIMGSTLRAIGLAHRAGVQILSGSDASDVAYIFPGSSLHEELELLVEAGLSAPEALRTATMNPARYLEATDSLGTVAAGKLADLVLLDANPLEDIRNTQQISGVVLKGRYLDREALDALLAEAEQIAQAEKD